MAIGRISARDCVFSIGGVVVGGAEEMTVNVKSENAVAHEAGSYWGAEIVAGKRTVNGTVNGALIDDDLIQELIPTGKLDLLPEFVITGEVVSGVEPKKKITVFGAKFNSLAIADLTVSAEYAKVNRDFDALTYSIVTE